MNKFLLESGWKAEVQKFKLKDNTVQHALADYAKIAEEKHPDRLKALKHVGEVAGALKKSKEIAAHTDVVKYLAEVIKGVDAEEREVLAAVAAKTTADLQAATEAAKKLIPDPEMLKTVYQIGVYDGENEEKSERSFFAKAPPFQKKYDEGYGWGKMIAEKIRAKGPQDPGPSMSPITEEQEKRDNEYTRRRQARKEFIQYMNDQWSTVLPEDM